MKNLNKRALEWWNELDSFNRRTILTNNKDLIGRSLTSLTSKEIEEIWKIEMNEKDNKLIEEMEWDYESIDQNLGKSNDIEANLKLLNELINKLTSEEKLYAINLLISSLEHNENYDLSFVKGIIEIISNEHKEKYITK